MKAKNLLQLSGSICFSLILVALSFLGACSEPETKTASTTAGCPNCTSSTTSTTTTWKPTTSTTTSPTYVSLYDELVKHFEKSDVTITSADFVYGHSGIPPYYDVRGKISSTINFVVELPRYWNGKFYMVGNGAFAGYIDFTSMETALRMGYATAATDTGHDSNVDPFGGWGASFAYNNSQAEIDYCYLAVHLTVVTAKEIIELYYGNPVSYAYFVSCSNGGRQGMMEAQRYPEDFDGIAVGAPIVNFTMAAVWGIWSAKALLGDGNIPTDKIKILADAVYAKCDGVDGLVDGLINDPRNCTFDPETDLPAGSFTPAQIEALKKLYGGAKNSEGEVLFPGLPLGAEIFANGLTGWSLWLDNFGSTGFTLLVSDNLMKYLAFKTDPGPDYDWQTFDFDTDPPKMAYMSSILDTLNPDLSAFKAHGGKIIHYHGWCDVGVNPMISVDYYESVLDHMGIAETMDFYRLYMVPGMFHCGGGVGCDSVDWFTPLVKWVEKGIAPEGLIGSHVEGGKVTRTRPLYPYPAVAVYTGSGSIDDAANFTSSGYEESPTTTDTATAVLYEVCACHRTDRKETPF